MLILIPPIDSKNIFFCFVFGPKADFEGRGIRGQSQQGLRLLTEAFLCLLFCGFVNVSLFIVIDVDSVS